MSYTVGNLELSILGFSEKAIASIDATTKSLNSLARAIDKINRSQFALAGQKLELIFAKIAQASNSISTNNLKDLASVTKSLSSLSKIGNLQNIDYEKVSQGLVKISNSIAPLINKVKEAETSLNALYKILQTTSSEKNKSLLGEVSGGRSNQKGKSSLNSLLNIGKWTITIHSARRLGSVLANIAQKGADFSETLNLWKVSMGQEFLPQATEFVNKLNEAYGISKETLMNSQAIFKNMLGSLGQISEQTAYSLSEGITQMALDYASLYNVQFDEAMTKFQAALAGQVRPIRSVAGYDITENTLFQLYQQLGGEKTMRQLSRTEKQLLAIYAVFQQMERSGADGDLGRTLGSFANQSRIAKDSFKDILTYSGLIFTRWVQNTKLFQNLNGFLIFIGDVLEAVANTMPDIELNGDPMANMAESAEQTNEEIDEIQKKLLDFDKFRSLSSTESEDNDLELDKTVLEALSKYESVFNNVDETSKKFAENLKIASGLFDENGVFNKERWDEIAESIQNIGIIIGIVFGVATLNKILDFIGKIDLARSSIDLLSYALEGMALYYIIEAINAFKDGDYWAGIFDTAIAVGLVGAFLLLKKTVLKDGIPYIELFGKRVNGTFGIIATAITTLIGGIGKFIQNFEKLSDSSKVWVPVLATLAGAIAAVVAGVTFLKGDWVGAIGIGAIITGIGLTVGTELSVPQYAEGGLPDKGTVFVAGEAGAEMVYNMPSGQSGVANIQQISQATYNGTVRALNDWWGGNQAKQDIPQLREANPTGLYEAVSGVAKSQGKVWANVQ